MRPIQVELSPGTEHKSRPALRPSLDRAEYLQRASRDAYYYDKPNNSNNNSSSHHNNDGPLASGMSRTPLQATVASPETMLEVELDAILRGDGRGARRQSTGHHTSDSLEKVLSVLPSHAPAQSSARKSCVTTQGSLRTSTTLVTPSDRSRRRCSVMQHSIDRFLRASEDREEEREEKSTGDSSHKNTPASRGVTPETTFTTAASPRPLSHRVSPEEKEGDAAANATALSRALFDTAHRSACKGLRQGSVDSDRSSLLPAPRTTAQPPTQSSSAKGSSRLLQNLPVNTISFVATSSTPKYSGSKRYTLGSRQLDACSSLSRAALPSVPETPDSSSSHPLAVAEVAVMCEACEVLVKVFVFVPGDAATPSLVFCPFCGCRCASV